MAIEIVRQVWCDIHLKSKKKKVAALEAAATVLHQGQTISIDLCTECGSTLTWAQILEFGSAAEQPKLSRERLSSRIKDKPAPTKKSGPGSYSRVLVECSICGKQMTSGAGFALHNKVHERDDGKSANPIPVAS